MIIFTLALLHVQNMKTIKIGMALRLKMILQVQGFKICSQQKA